MNGHSILSKDTDITCVNGLKFNGTTTNGYHLNKHTTNDEIKNRPPGRHVFILSGKDEAATNAMISRLAIYLSNVQEANREILLADLAYTLDQRRTRFPWRIGVAATTLEELKTTLTNRSIIPTRPNKMPRIGFVFTGQGAQWHAMGRELIHSYPIFRNTLIEANQYLQEFGASWDLLGMLPLTCYYKSLTFNRGVTKRC